MVTSYLDLYMVFKESKSFDRRMHCSEDLPLGASVSVTNSTRPRYEFGNACHTDSFLSVSRPAFLSIRRPASSRVPVEQSVDPGFWL